MIVVTGGAGFVGSNIVKGLNERGINDIIVVDDLSDGHKFENIVDCNIADYIDHLDFIQQLEEDKVFAKHISAVFHQGACSDTTEWDGQYMMDNNYTFSKKLLHSCMENETPFIYASSAAVYGNSTIFKEEAIYEKPVNIYGYSKLLFDNYVRGQINKANSQIVGLRYFNVYGAREQHKGKMASVAFHFNQQIKQQGYCNLFEGSGGYGNGEQLRDFIYVEDIIDINLWFFDNSEKSGIFNAGTGNSQRFNDVADAAIKWHGKGEKKYIPFPDNLKGHYQSYTQADISNLRNIGYKKSFHTVEAGVTDYLNKINE